jgi:hypothetical protein
LRLKERRAGPFRLPFLQMDSRSFSIMSCSLSHIPTPSNPTFASAVLRHGRAGRAEHEWFRPDADRAGGIDLPDAHMLVLEDECVAGSVGEPITVSLVVAPGSEAGAVEIAHDLAGASELHVTDARMVPVADRESGEPGRIRIPLGNEPVSISARLATGARLRVRLVAA